MDSRLIAPSRETAIVIAANLALFILVTSLPAFQRAHHHWIFPVLAALLAAQWALSLAVPKNTGLRLRSAILAALAFVLVMGIVRHATILACFDRCAFKLAGAAAIAAPVFLAQRLLKEPGVWEPERATLAALASLTWAFYLLLRGFQVAPWSLNVLFVIVTLLFWLGRSSAPFLVASLGVLSALVIRSIVNEYVVIALGVVWGVALPLAVIPKVSAWLKTRPKPPPPDLSLFASARRITIAVAVVWGLITWIAGPMEVVTNPAKRQAFLKAAAPPAPQAPGSPLARRLRDHVLYLSQTLRERGVGNPKQHAAARDYVLEQLRKAGYLPRTLPFESKWLAGTRDGTKLYNVEAILAHAPADAGHPWIIGAHYDTAPETPGADDNASAVAVLIEAARLLKASGAPREIRFVAFDTEEPPSFGTRNMGSYHYARMLKESGTSIHGMMSLEMLGYYNPRSGSQLYPPFMHLLFPADGDFVAVVGDVRSFALTRIFASIWRGTSSFPLEASILPGPFSSLALSDQLNFWAEGYPALMLSDTAFYRNPNYHEATDVPDTLDFEKMARVTSALARTLALESK